MSVTREARAATIAARESNLPVWLAFTVDDKDGRLLRSGESLAGAAEAITAAGAESILVNCSVPEAVTTAMDELAKTGVTFGGYANAFKSVDALAPGGTVDVLEVRKDMDPVSYAEHGLGWVRLGASIVGGCCEAGPEHIKALTGKLIDAGYVTEQ